MKTLAIFVMIIGVMMILFLTLDPDNGMVWGLLTGGIIIFLVMLLVLCYFVLAPKKKFFTFGRENMAEYVMIGKKFSGIVILPSKTVYVDKEYNIRDISPESNVRKQRNFLGMYWVGIYPIRSIYERHQQWLEWESTENGREILFRDELTPYLIVKPFEYAMLLKEGEDKNGVPLNVYFTVILKPVNAVLPIFGNDDAYGQVQTLCLAEALLFVKEKTFANLGGENVTSDILKDEFSLAIGKLNEEIPGRLKEDPSNPKERVKVGLKEALGYEILDAKLNSVEVAGTYKEDILKATTAKYVAGENKEAAVLEAEGKEAGLNVQKRYLQGISAIPGAMKVEERRATPALTTLVEAGSDGKTGLLIGGK